jgi:hypothetical protein
VVLKEDIPHVDTPDSLRRRDDRAVDPRSACTAWIMDGRFRAPGPLQRVEEQIDTGHQDWKQYAVAMLIWNTLAFVVGFLILQFQPYLPLNPDNKGCSRRARSSTPCAPS